MGLARAGLPVGKDGAVESLDYLLDRVLHVSEYIFLARTFVKHSVVRAVELSVNFPLVLLFAYVHLSTASIDIQSLHTMGEFSA